MENNRDIFDKNHVDALLRELAYLTDARNLVAHSNMVVDAEVGKIKAACATVRRIFPV